MQKKIPDHAHRVFKGVLFDVYQWQQEMFDGSFETFEAIRRNTSVTILAITSEGKLLINNEEQPYKGSFVSFPGGQSEDREDLFACAQRELLEETGYISDDWVTWHSWDILKTSKIDWLDQYYIARNCRKVAEIRPDPGEKIETREYSFEEFIEITQREDFRNREVSEIIKEIKHHPGKLAAFRKEIFGE